MFALVILWGTFSYTILVLGWLQLLSGSLATICLLIACAITVVFMCRAKPSLPRLSWPLMGIAVSAVVNLIGALGPELGFDALWYHLTIPRIWLMEGRIFNIPGGYFYYSLLPKSIDLIYLSLLPTFGALGPKVVHWGFGLLAAAVTYKIARKWLSVEWSVFSALIFYANLVVGWQSITAYVDLGRTVVEALAFYYLVNKQLTKSAVTLGFAITTKFLALGSLPIFLVLLLLQKVSIKSLCSFILITLLIPSPWWIWAYVQTGNPLYPIFSGYDLSSVHHWWDMFTIWLRASDPISPIYFMVFPLWLPFRKKIPVTVTIYCLLSLLVWSFIPRTGGGRFLLPYLPVFSVLASLLINNLKNSTLKKILIGFVITISVINMGWRFLANVKYIPAELGLQSHQEFLTKYLYQFGHNFYYLSDEQLKRLYE